MSNSFDITEVDHLTTGTVGPPGQRVFYLQVAGSGQMVTLKLEKTQVAALVTYLRTLLSDLPDTDSAAANMDLIEPVAAEWVVGSLGVSYEEETDRVLIVAEEMVVDDEGDIADVAPGIVGQLRVLATREQVAALTAHGAAVVQAGRPPCPLCGQPVDPEGHVCVRLNGHLRRMR